MPNCQQMLRVDSFCLFIGYREERIFVLTSDAFACIFRLLGSTRADSWGQHVQTPEAEIIDYSQNR